MTQGLSSLRSGSRRRRGPPHLTSATSRTFHYRTHGTPRPPPALQPDVRQPGWLPFCSGPPDSIPPVAPRTPPIPRAWDGKPAAHRRGAAPQQPATTTAQAAEAHCRAIRQMDDDDDRPQTARWLGISPGHSRRHTPQVQGCHSPTAEYHACTIVWLEATVDNYTWAIEQVEEDDDGPQTARWSGSGPSRGRRCPS
jgi:hypothetical protein